MKNALVVKILREISYALELRGVEFKPRAYARAARSIEGLSKDVSVIYDQGGKEALKEIPGVGESIAEKIEEIIKTGKLKYYQKLLKEIPFKFSELMNIQGLGPKTVKRLHDELGIKDLNELKKAAKQGKIRKLEGFGEKSEQKILKHVKQAWVKKDRVLISTAYSEAQGIKNKLKELCNELMIAGSIRRMKESIGDIDVLVVPKKGKHDSIVKKYLSFGQEVAKGRTKVSIRLESGINSDLRIIDQESWGAALNYFTGSKDHNIALRKIAQSKGWKLSEYGLFKDDERIAGRTEKGVYNKLGLSYVPPELRENNGEIEAVKRDELPELIPYDALKGDLQCHTKYSDGENTVKEMVEKSKALGYEYLGITDHAGKLEIANSMSEKEIRDQAQEIKELSVKGIKVLHGVEVNILPDGSLDVKDKVLEELDFVVASIHSKFSLSKKEMTNRLIKAMKHPLVNIIGHPTGRKVLVKEGYELDWSRVFKASKEHNTYLEINAYPERLDLPDVKAREAVSNGCKLFINTDAHSTSQLEYMKFGVGQARRGWVTQSNVINTISYKSLLKKLKK